LSQDKSCLGVFESISISSLRFDQPQLLKPIQSQGLKEVQIKRLEEPVSVRSFPMLGTPPRRIFPPIFFVDDRKRKRTAGFDVRFGLRKFKFPKAREVFKL